MAGIKIKRNDMVVVIAGKSKSDRPHRVLRVITDKNRVLVEGVNMMKKHLKPNPQKNIQGGILEQEAPIHISNVMLVDSDGKRSRVGSKIDGDTKVRIAKSNGQAIVTKK